MEGFVLFIAILYTVFGILNIILFFKIWKMTDDTAQIKEFVPKKHNPMLEAIGMSDKLPAYMRNANSYLDEAERIWSIDNSREQK
ncbi:MAG: hypothetical protein LUD17_01650 [Bacteroidales bacterium]|nr:hypothetical protein [Bacteroidales bacterium]